MGPVRQVAVTVAIAVVVGSLAAFLVGRATADGRRKSRSPITAEATAAPAPTAVEALPATAPVEESPADPEPVPVPSTPDPAPAVTPAPSSPTSTTAPTPAPRPAAVAAPAPAPVPAPEPAPAATVEPEPAPVATTTTAAPKSTCQVSATYQGHDAVRYAVTSNMPGHRVRITKITGRSEALDGWLTTDDAGDGSLDGDASGAQPGTTFRVRADFYRGSTFVTYCETSFTVT